MQLYGEVVRAHRSSLVFTVHNVRERAAPLAALTLFMCVTHEPLY